MSSPEQGQPLTRRQLRELAAAQEAAAQAARAERERSASAASAVSGGSAPSGAASGSSPTTASSAPVQATSPTQPTPAGSVQGAPVPPVQQQAPAPSRRALRERAMAAQQTHSVAPSQGIRQQPVPVVQPPAATGAIRALDETGQLTPIRPVTTTRGGGFGSVPGIDPEGEVAASSHSQSSGPTPGSPNQPFARVGVRESIQQVEAQSQPRVYPRPGSTPAPAAPVGQRTTLSGAEANAMSWTPASSGTAGAAGAVGAGAASPSVGPTSPSAAPTSPSAVPAGPAAVPGASSSGQVGGPAMQVGPSAWAPTTGPAPTTSPADATSTGQFNPQLARGAFPSVTTPSPEQVTQVHAPVSSAQATASPAQTAHVQTPSGAPQSFVPRAEGEDEAVPQWAAVGGSAQQGQQQGVFAPVGTPPRAVADDDVDEDPDSWRRYTPLQYLVLIVLGLILGGVVWQLLNSGTDSAGAQTASAGVVVEQADAAPGSTDETFA